MKLIAITGKAQTGKGVVTQLLQHHLMLQGKRVFVLPVALPLYAKCVGNSINGEVAYLDLIFNKEIRRKELQEAGDVLNREDSVLGHVLKIVKNVFVDRGYDYILLDSWRATDSYKLLNDYCTEHDLPAPHLITVGSNRVGIKGSGLEHHKSEGSINDWPLHLRSLITNDVGISYEIVSLQVEHLIQTGRF